MIARRFTIAGLAWGLAVSLVAVLLVLLISSNRVIDAMTEVSQRWQTYDVDGATKADSLLEIEKAMGFGGVILYFRDYQFGGTAADRLGVEKSIQLARANISTYRSAGALEADENVALDHVSAVLDAIEAQLPQIESLHKTALPAHQIIANTNIDLTPARDGLEVLGRVLALERSTLGFQADSAIDRANRITWWAAGVNVVLLFVMAAISIWFIRQRVLKPLKRLGQQSALLASQQLDETFAWEQSDEMGDLGHILDDSRVALKKLFAEVDENARHLAHQATHDALTGLPNRSYLLDWLSRTMVPPANGGQRTTAALLFLDLDGFKVINDTLGHAVGDHVLIAVATRIAERVSDNAFVSRLGGDEFVVAIPEGGEERAFAIAERMEIALRAPFFVDGMELAVSTSIGIAVDDGTSTDSVSLLRDADIALYRAKESGQGQKVLFNTDLREAILIRRRLQQDLVAATQSGEIYLVYQPITAIEGNRLVGFEALVRWQHPELGMISPVKFIPIAEDTGQILPLGRYVLEKAAETAEIWRQRYALDTPLTVNVNLSPRQMWDDAYVAEMLTFLGSQARGLLKIEVTEGMTVANPDKALTLLRHFQGLGIPLCIDDFGTGYSSLSYLHRFPFDVLKIDKSFITDFQDSHEKSRLVRSIIQMAHDLDMQVVAEGVETDAELSRLREYGCDYCQGYLFSRPMLEHDAEAYITARYEVRV